MAFAHLLCMDFWQLPFMHFMGANSEIIENEFRHLIHVRSNFVISYSSDFFFKKCRGWEKIKIYFIFIYLMRKTQVPHDNFL